MEGGNADGVTRGKLNCRSSTKGLSARGIALDAAGAAGPAAGAAAPRGIIFSVFETSRTTRYSYMISHHIIYSNTI